MNKKLRSLNVRLMQTEKAEVKSFETEESSWAFKFLFRGRSKSFDEDKWLPINVKGLIDWDDDNIIKRAKKEARKFFNSLMEKNGEH